MEPKSKKIEEAAVPRKKFHVFGYILLAILIVVAVLYARNRQAQNIVSGVISSPSETLNNLNDRTNVVLLGIGGEGHEGADLTDSILFLSFNLKNNTALMIPIPRDIWIPSMKAKINTAYHYGNERRDGGGTDLAKSAVAELLGVPIHYSVVLDFQGFVKAIDAVGGVDVDVERTFDDYLYPIPGKETAEPESARYEHIHFDKGLTHMDGTTALKFARSRHAEGDEGTDFARGMRQQKILLAFRNKVISISTIFNSDIVNNLRSTLADSLVMDVNSKEQGAFFKVFLGLGSKENIKSIEITNYLTNPKISREYGGQWVLIPSPSLADLQTYVKDQLAQ